MFYLSNAEQLLWHFDDIIVCSQDPAEWEQVPLQPMNPMYQTTIYWLKPYCTTSGNKAHEWGCVLGNNTNNSLITFGFFFIQ